MKKIIRFLKTYVGHIVCKAGIVIAYIPMMFADDIVVVKGFSAFALLFFLLYTFLPIDGYAYTLEKFKVFLKKEIKEKKELDYIYKKLESLEGDI